MFKNNAHVGAFMKGIQQLIEIESPADLGMFENNFVDMAIYTRVEQRDVVDDKQLLVAMFILFLLVQIAWVLRPLTIC